MMMIIMIIVLLLMLMIMMTRKKKMMKKKMIIMMMMFYCRFGRRNPLCVYFCIAGISCIAVGFSPHRPGTFIAHTNFDLI